MLVLRTVFLWLAFAVLLFLELNILPELYLKVSAVMRLIPSALLLAWFVIYIFNKDKSQLSKHAPKAVVLWLSVLKTVANLAIVTGAVMRIMHYSHSQLLLVSGIGFLALWSSVLAYYSELKSDFNPDIIDAVDDDEN